MMLGKDKGKLIVECTAFRHPRQRRILNWRQFIEDGSKPFFHSGAMSSNSDVEPRHHLPLRAERRSRSGVCHWI